MNKYIILSLVLSCLIAGIVAPCSVPGVGSGLCQDKTKNSCSGGRFYAGYCPGTNNIQCCVKGGSSNPPRPPPNHAPPTGVGKTCSVSGKAGVCQDKSRTSCSGGSYYAGYCPGSSNVQCCVKGGVPPGPNPGTKPSNPPNPPRPSGPVGNKRMNQAGIDLVKSFEGWFSCYYKDPVGLPTIGYGHLIVAGDPYRPGTCLTKAQGEALLAKDLQSHVSCMNRAIKVPVSCNEFAALVSWSFNVGCNAASSSTLIRQLNSGNKGAVCSELAKWNKAGGKVLPGLTRRRSAECDLFRRAGGTGC